MQQLRIFILPAMLAACGGLAGCTTDGGTASLADAAPTVSPADPALPEMVAALPESNPTSDGLDLGQRSLAADVEQGASLPSAYSGGTVSNPAAAAALSQPALATGGQPPVLLASADDGLDPGGLALRMRPEPVDAPVGKFGPDGAVAARSPELDSLIKSYSEHYEVPESLVRRVARRESRFNPQARNGPYWGLMQISHATARGMGYLGEASGLLDAETNLKYAVRYLRGAYMVARGNEEVADQLYQRGYYFDAKRMGLLDETGLGTDRKRSRF
ncbi:MAG: lytic transglycosylase domain-containing protein [Rhizobiaceae bacterium]|nr:lytic transglycosylase domain-containing protein [Rhizobiaceae bacterium]